MVKLQETPMRLSCASTANIFGKGRERPALQNLLPMIRDAGFEAVELAWSQVESSFTRARNRTAAVRSLLEENGLLLSGIEAAELSAVWEGQLPERAAAVREHMQAARELGVPAVNVRTGERKKQERLLLITQLDAVLRTADELDMTVHLGNGRGTRIEQLDDLHMVLLHISHPRLRLMVDTGQFHEAAVNPRDALRAFEPRIGLIRIGDRIARRWMLPGRGESNVPAIIEHARAIGYDGWLVVEPPPVGEPDRAARMAAAFSCLQPLVADH
jgi:sugar phosphate isomerase/epimerase